MYTFLIYKNIISSIFPNAVIENEQSISLTWK